MKKVIKFIIFIIIGSLTCYGIYNDIDRVNKQKIVKTTKEEVIDYNGAKYNGWLQVSGNKLLNEHKKEIQLKGISTHGIQWFGHLYTYENLQNLKDTWGINTFRISLYTDPNSDGYIKNKELKNQVIKLIDYSIKLDMYVIVDWHILNDNNPQTYKKEAIEFFNEISKKYKNNNNVIYEICNEPNGNVTWEKDIYPYANDIIKVIRKNSKKALVIVGTPDWCKDLDSVSKKPLKYKNVIYSLHFYAGSHDKKLRDKIDKFREKDLAVFVSECGITDVSGNGKIYEEKFKEWTNYLDEKNISWIFWALSNKNESSSLLTEDYEVLDSYIEIGENGSLTVKKGNDLNDYLTEVGYIVKNIMTK